MNEKLKIEMGKLKYISAFCFLLSALSASGANLLPNSSFEVGNRGWHTHVRHDAYGNTNELTTTFGNASGNHGSYAAHLEFNQVLFSRPLDLVAGTYKITFDAKRTGADNAVKVNLTARTSFYAWGSSYQQNVTTSWARYTNTITLGSDGYYSLSFAFGGTGITVDLDAVQLELTTATAYAPKNDVEVGLWTGKRYNTYYSTDTKEVDVLWFNDAGTEATDVVAAYEFRGLQNQLLSSGYLTNASIAADTREVTQLAIPQNGFHRATIRLTGTDDSRDEITLNVIPGPAGTGGDNPIASHYNYGTPQLEHAKASGIGAVRVLSTAGDAINEWPLVEPSEGSFSWSLIDGPIEALTNTMPRLLIPVGFEQIDNITGPINSASWMTNGDGSLKVASYTNYLYELVSRHPGIWAVEILNEPSHSQGAWLHDPDNYASVLGPAAQAVKDANPDTLVVGMAGVPYTSHGSNGWDVAVWDALDAGEKANIDAVSFHFYPFANNEGDDMTSPTSKTANSYPAAAASNWSGEGVELWNTESGTWTGGDYRGEEQWRYNPDASVTYEFQRAEPTIRTAIATERILLSALRSLGAGLNRFFYYGHWSWNTENLNNNQPYAFDNGTESEKAMQCALEWLAYLLRDAAQPENITNTSTNGFELVAWDGVGSSNVVACVNRDRIHRVITPTSSSFTLYDCMGNEIALSGGSFIQGRLPYYAVSTSLSYTAMKSAFTGATVSPIADTNGPNVSIDIAPSGPTSAGTHRFKWSGQDDFWWNDSASGNNENVRFRYRVDEGSWSSYAQDTFADIALSGGEDSFTVEAIDSDGNTGEVVYYFTFEPPEQPVSSAGGVFVENVYIGF